jgi:hypothetical protein
MPKRHNPTTPQTKSVCPSPLHKHHKAYTSSETHAAVAQSRSVSHSPSVSQRLKKLDDHGLATPERDGAKAMFILSAVGTRVLRSTPVSSKVKQKRSRDQTPEEEAANLKSKISLVVDNAFSKYCTQSAAGAIKTKIQEEIADRQDEFLAAMNAKGAEALVSIIHEVECKIPEPSYKTKLFERHKVASIERAKGLIDKLRSSKDFVKKSSGAKLGYVSKHIAKHHLDIDVKIAQKCCKLTEDTKNKSQKPKNFARQHKEEFENSDFAISDEAKEALIVQALMDEYEGVFRTNHKNTSPIKLKISDGHSQHDLFAHCALVSRLTEKWLESVYRSVEFAFNDGTLVKEGLQCYDSKAKVSHVYGIKAYPDIAESFEAMRVKHNLKDPEIAQAILDYLDEGKSKIFDGVEGCGSAIKLVARSCYLLFSTEASRDNSALIAASMFLDLVIAGKYKIGDIVDLPLSMKRAVPATRALSKVLGGLITDHSKYDHSQKAADIHSSDVKQILGSSIKLLKNWLALKGITIDKDHTIESQATEISDTILKAAEGWYKLNLRPFAKDPEIVSKDKFMKDIDSAFDSTELLGGAAVSSQVSDGCPLENADDFLLSATPGCPAPSLMAEFNEFANPDAFFG